VLGITSRQPTLTVAPTAAAQDAPIILSGGGMIAGDSILLTGPFVSVSVTADNNGAFIAATQVGSAYAPGTYALTARDMLGGPPANTELTVTQTQ
jgi:hypothetical protein